MIRALWVFNLPKKSKILVKENQKVKAGDKLGEFKKDAFLSPVDGLVLQAKEAKIKIEFSTEKIEGKAFGQGRNWGQVVAVDDGFLALNCNLSGKIVFITRVDDLFVNKAEALGVSGIVCLDCAIENKNHGLPLLVIEDDKDSIVMLKRSSKINCLIDVGAGCIFIPNNKNEN